ncbi:tetratricopeptide repeat protein [Ectopseudomonas toyotomiensis]|uniref:tetratricopeptide repeat protein n=1 Tax=Ectopseudomonas toyotomiensis TaxID=554344 RepID=UPI0037C8E5DB
MLGWVIVGGFVGGLCDFLNRFKPELDKGKILFQGMPVGILQTCSLGLMNSVLGIGGAFAVQFAIISIGKFSGADTTEAKMLLLTVSVVSGFGGRRFLSLVSNKLEDQIGEAKRLSEEAQEDAEESIALSKALATVRQGSTTSERVEAVNMLERFLKRHPKDRAITILAGRIHRMNHDLQSAIAVLSKYLESKGGERDKDYADVLYNRACYKILSATSNGGILQKLVDDGLKDLKQSVELSAENARDALEDDDFSAVKDSDEFKKIVQ